MPRNLNEIVRSRRRLQETGHSMSYSQANVHTVYWQNRTKNPYCILEESFNKNRSASLWTPYFSSLEENCGCVEKPAETLRLASHLVTAINSRSGGHKFGKNSVHWLKSGKTLGVRSFYSGDPDVITWSSQSVWLCNARSLACHWQTHLPDATAGLCNTHSLAHHWQTYLPDATSLHPSAVPSNRVIVSPFLYKTIFFSESCLSDLMLYVATKFDLKRA